MKTENQSIRAIQRELDALLLEYHEKCRPLKLQIENIRKKRGTKLVEHEGRYFEQGRDREYTRG